MKIRDICTKRMSEIGTWIRSVPVTSEKKLFITWKRFKRKINLITVNRVNQEYKTIFSFCGFSGFKILSVNCGPDSPFLRYFPALFSGVIFRHFLCDLADLIYAIISFILIYSWFPKFKGSFDDGVNKQIFF